MTTIKKRIGTQNPMIKKAFSTGEVTSTYKFIEAEVGKKFTTVIANAPGQRDNGSGKFTWYKFVLENRTGMNVLKPSSASWRWKSETPSFDDPKSATIVFRSNDVLASELYEEFGHSVCGKAIKPPMLAKPGHPTSKFQGTAHSKSDVDQVLSWESDLK